MAVDKSADPFERARVLSDRVATLRDETLRTQAELYEADRRLHAGGVTLREIADRLGLSHQRVHQIVKGQSEKRGGLLRFGRSKTPNRGPFEALSPRALSVLDRAYAEADALSHDYLGTEHILLALAADDGPAAAALADCGISADRIRDGIRLLVGRGPGEQPGSPRRVMPRTKRALGRASREAGDGEIDDRHLLLGLLLETDGLAAKMLDEFGCGNVGAVRRALGG